MGRVIQIAAILLLIGPGDVIADPARSTLFDLQLGQPASHLPAAFRSYACGNEGGPPGAVFSGWKDYLLCPPDRDGLHEVAVEYDDTAERAARVNGDPAAAWGLGTSLNYFPIVASALFNDAGTLEGLRIVTDARPDQRKDPFMLYRPYGEHYLLQLYLMDRFGMRPTDCKDLPLGNGQSAVFGMSTNRVCDRTDLTAKRHYHIEARFYRRRGEHDFDPDSGRLAEGQFLSETRAEIRAIGG